MFNQCIANKLLDIRDAVKKKQSIIIIYYYI